MTLKKTGMQFILNNIYFVYETDQIWVAIIGIHTASLLSIIISLFFIFLTLSWI